MSNDTPQELPPSIPPPLDSSGSVSAHPGRGSFLERIKKTHKKYEHLTPAVFFVLGFVYDLITLGRIDQGWTIIQQALFLLVVLTLLSFEIVHERVSFTVPQFLNKAWTYRIEMIHFLFGSLLSGFTLFYFKSASLLSSFVFISILAALLVANEFDRFKKMGAKFKIALLSLCLVSFLACTIPTLLGFIGLGSFLIVVGSAALLLAFWTCILNRSVSFEFDFTKTILIPSACILSGFTLLYILKLIPPVPLSIQYMGIYHNIEKSNGNYIATYSRPWWKFWQNGDQDFVASENDRIFCFIRVFSPTAFKDEVKLRWLFKHPKFGWQDMDRIPFTIVGGRADGYRGFGYKSNYQPGRWRVQVETSDEREIGRLYFTVHSAEADTFPEYRTEQL